MKFIHSQSRSIWQSIHFLALLFMLVSPQPGAVSAQQTGEIVFENISVDIRPEYDRPSVLIIYQATLSAQVSLPATINFRIPAGAGKPFALAWQSTDKGLYDLKYASKAAGDWVEIEFSTPSPDFQIEYYDPGLKKTGSKRDFTYRWPGNYTVNNFALQVQQPVNATNMKFVPAAGSGQAGSDGLVYYPMLVGQVNSGTTFDLAMSYTKADNTLTNPEKFQDASPNQPLNSGTAGRVALDQFLPWGVGGLGFLLIAAGSFWYWKTGRRSSSGAASRRARHARPVKPAAETNASDEAIFCHQCGKKAGPGDAFCRACGTKLR